MNQLTQKVALAFQSGVSIPDIIQLVLDESGHAELKVACIDIVRFVDVYGVYENPSAKAAWEKAMQRTRAAIANATPAAPEATKT